MRSEAFYAPAPGDGPERFRLDVAKDLCVGVEGRRFLMGGVAFGATITALERRAGRPLSWATAQFLAAAAPGESMDIDVDLQVEGRRVTQAHARSAVGSRAVLSAQAALGGRDATPAQFATMPDVPPPEACTLDTVEPLGPDDLRHRLERRRPHGDARDNEGHARMWIRTLADEPITAGLLAIYADFLPGAIDRTRGSSSLDNTLRVHARPPTRWCLLDMRIHGTAAGIFHGEMRVFAREGTLLATASQSGVLPRRD